LLKIQNLGMLNFNEKNFNHHIFNRVMENYEAWVRCSNCGQASKVDIPKGTTKNGYCQSGKCPQCGCQTIKPE